MVLEGYTETETTRPKLSDNSSVAKKREDVKSIILETCLAKEI